MRALLTALGATAFALLLAAAPARAQAPAPVLEPRGACPADVDIVYDVSSVAGAARTRYRIRRAGVGLENVLLNDAAGRVARDLRPYAHPVLDGTAYEVQVRAYSATGAEIGNWSAAAQVAGDLTPTGRFTATAGSGNAIELSWDLAADASLAGCADRVRWEVKSGAFASATAADPAATTGVASGTSGSQTITVPGPGSYQVRLLALYGGEAATDAIGRWSDPLSVTIASGTQVVRVQAVDADATRCRGLANTTRPEPRPAALIAVRTDAGDDTRLEADRAGQAAFELPAGVRQIEVTAESPSGGGVCRAQPLTVTLPSSGLVQIQLEGCVSPDGDRAVAFGAASTTTRTAGRTLTGSARNTASLNAASGAESHVIVRGVAGHVAPPGELVVELIPETTTQAIGAQPLQRATVLRERFPAICAGEERAFPIPAPARVPPSDAYAYVAALGPDRADADPSNDLARSRTVTGNTTTATGGAGAPGGVTATVRVTSANPVDVNLVLGEPAKTVMLNGERLDAATGAVLIDRNGNAVGGVSAALRPAQGSTVRGVDLAAPAGAIVSSYRLALTVPGSAGFVRVDTPVTVLVTRAPSRLLEFATEPLIMTGLGYDDLILEIPAEPIVMTGLHYNQVLEITTEPIVMTGLHYDNLVLEITTEPLIMTGAEE